MFCFQYNLVYLVSTSAIKIMYHSSSSLESCISVQFHVLSNTLQLLTKYLQNIYICCTYSTCLPVHVQMPCIKGRSVPFDRFLMEIYTCCMQVICHDWYIYIAGNVTCYDHCDIGMGWHCMTRFFSIFFCWHDKQKKVL